MTTKKQPYLYHGQTIGHWAHQLGISVPAMRRRIKSMPPYEAFQCPHYTFNGETMRVRAWAERLGISTTAMKFRIRRWPPEKAFTQPPGKQGPRQTSQPTSEHEG